MFASVIHNTGLRYPTGDEFYSPSTAWPEYGLAHVATQPNSVYDAVRQCLADAGLDAENFGKPEWNPLGRYISPGNKVFLLCNFVEQRVGANGDDPIFAKCTHASVIRAVADYVVRALQGKGSISFGNAPLQSCDWGAVTQQTGAARVAEFYAKFPGHGIQVRLADLRQHIIHRNAMGNVTTDYHAEAENACVEVNLGADSLLDQLYAAGGQPRFRVLDYDPRRTERCHERGRHVYLINRKIIESDVVISIPKLKTHEKVGITCGIKGCVGTVGHKDCLAHHRFGPPARGGDEFANSMSALRVFSALHDRVYSSKPGWSRTLLHSANFFSRKIIRRFTRAMSGSWPGNDTCWRMAVDLARVVAHADKSGRLQDATQRTHLLFTDGIVAGEGDGPLSPVAVPLGYLSFCDDLVIGDHVNALAMGYEPDKLPMLREPFKLKKYSLTEANLADASVRINGRSEGLDGLKREFGRKFLPPREWRQTL